MEKLVSSKTIILFQSDWIALFILAFNDSPNSNLRRRCSCAIPIPRMFPELKRHKNVDTNKTGRIGSTGY